MKLSWRFVGVALTLLPIMAGFGCTSDKALTPSNGQLELQLSMEPVAGERAGSKPPFVWTKGSFSSVTFRPVDSNNSVSFGTDPMQLLPRNTLVDMVTAGPQSIASVTVAGGTYQVIALVVTDFQLSTENSRPPADTDLCTISENQGDDSAPWYVPLDLNALTIQVDSRQSMTILVPNPPVVEIRPGASTVLRLVVRGDLIMPVLETLATCAGPNSNPVEARKALVGKFVAADLAPAFTFQVP
jgi:hypothetical protein